MFPLSHMTYSRYIVIQPWSRHSSRDVVASPDSGPLSPRHAEPKSLRVAFAQTPLLTNLLVRLEPLSQRYVRDQRAAVAVDERWHTRYATVPSPEQMTAGMTTFMNLDPHNRRLDLGSTWIGREAQRTGVSLQARPRCGFPGISACRPRDGHGGIQRPVERLDFGV